MSACKWSREEANELISTINQIKRENPERIFNHTQLAAEAKKVGNFDKFTESQIYNKIKRHHRTIQERNDRHTRRLIFSGPKKKSSSATKQTQQFINLASRTTSNKSSSTTIDIKSITRSASRNRIANTSTPQKLSSTQYLNPNGTFSGTESTTTSTPSTIPIVIKTPPSPPLPSNQTDTDVNMTVSNNNNSKNNSNETLTIYLPLCKGEKFKHTITPSGDIIVQVFRSDDSCGFTITHKLPHPMAGTYRAYFKRPLDYGMPVLATNKVFRDMYLQEMCRFTFKREIKEISEEVEL
ncbi:hypothetical protein DFA_04115 [Cavenderia fasciculata]|uniref:Uncharacterized protein n=1 Tax=Cavenderia fasciculata TaxID=261658 RepID=F4Q1B9_CACFS|nr:uncharacterized protein DFA_04115 [Cavenderia fasciculata]EGG18620.1 hypothetical protein DFA_04115 [Cavenderia fasciculata]|eukprot:XP_004366524.1 hypothetical protein DFA_04115 [Cavenderia fasciculata]